MRHILFPTDFSARCDAMARVVAALAHRCGAKVTILHVMESVRLSSDFALLEHHLATIIEELRGKLESYQTEVFAGLEVDREFKIGHAVTEIVDCAQSGSVDLIAMPTHGYTRFRELLLGSVTAGVLHDSETPVLTAAHAAEFPAEQVLPTRILCAIDLSPASIEILTLANNLATGLGASLEVIYGFPGFGAAGGFANVEWEVRAEEQRQEYARLAAAAEIEVPLTILDGPDVNESILGELAAKQSDLLILGRGKTQGVLGRLRTSAHDLIRRSPCPVLSV